MCFVYIKNIKKLYKNVKKFIKKIKRNIKKFYKFSFYTLLKSINCQKFLMPKIIFNENKKERTIIIFERKKKNKLFSLTYILVILKYFND